MQSFDFPTDSAFWQDPSPFYQAALNSGESVFAFSGGGYSILGYDALMTLGRDPRVDGFPLPPAGTAPGCPAIDDVLRWGLFALGAPQHRPLRQAVIGGISPSRIAALQPLAEQEAAGLAKALRARGGGDLIADFVRPLVACIFAGLVGLSRAEGEAAAADILAIGNHLAAPRDETAEPANAAAGALMRRLDNLQRSGRSALMDDIAARLPDGSAASAAELVASFSLDAVEMLASGLFCCLDVLLRQDRSVMAGGESTAAIHEAFRIASPAVLTSRIATEEIDYDDARIPAGSLLLMWWGSGNHDATAFADPQRFDATRPTKRHLAFGIGGHACLGQALAGMVAGAAAKALMSDGPLPVRIGPTQFLPRLGRIAELAPLAF